MLRIYERQKRGLFEPKPHTYMLEDILVRLPWEAGPPRPPFEVLNPILYDAPGLGKIMDPLTIHVGRLDDGTPFAYNPRLVVNPLMLIVGTPGAGKSATVKTLIYSLLSNEVLSPEGTHPPIFVVDPEGEYHVLGELVGEERVLHIRLGRRDYINILERPSKRISPISWYMRLVPVLQEFLQLRGQAPQAYRALREAVLKAAQEKGLTRDPSTWHRDDITLEDVYNWLQKTKDAIENKPRSEVSEGERRLLQGISTLFTRLEMWFQPPNDAFSKRSTVDMANLFRYRLVIFDARGLAQDLFNLFTYWLVYYMYSLMLEKGPLPEFGVRVVLVLDEAWILLKKREGQESPLEALARRGRKYGIMIWVATQTVEDVDEKMFSLFGTVVVGKLRSEKMIRKLRESLGLPKQIADSIKSLPQGSLVWSIAWRRTDFPMHRVPLTVKTDYPIGPLIQFVDA